MREIISGFLFTCTISVLLAMGVVVGLLCIFAIMAHSLVAIPLLLISISLTIYLMDKLS
jgi:hypothetical protein